MATLHLVFARAGDSGIEVMPAKPRVAETITTSGTSQQSNISAETGDFAAVTVTGGNVWLRFGASPPAASGGGWLLADGDTIYLGGLTLGDKLAVIDA